jgi:hypothetical protein
VRHYPSIRACASPPRRALALPLPCDKADNSARQTNTRHAQHLPSVAKVWVPVLPRVAFELATSLALRVNRAARATGRVFGTTPARRATQGGHSVRVHTSQRAPRGLILGRPAAGSRFGGIAQPAAGRGSDGPVSYHGVQHDQRLPLHSRGDRQTARHDQG